MAEASSEHDEIIALFQQITHNENTDECRHILESTNWQLDRALDFAFNTVQAESPSIVQDNVGLPIGASLSIGPLPRPPIRHDVPLASPVVSKSPIRVIDSEDEAHNSDKDVNVVDDNPFAALAAGISHKPNDASQIKLKVMGPAGREVIFTGNDTCNWGEFRKFCHREFKIPESEPMILTGIEGSCTAQPEDPLAAYPLADDGIVYLHTGPTKARGTFKTPLMTSRRIQLNVTNIQDGTEKDIYMNAKDTVREFKHTAQTIFNIPPRHQVWKGWPPKTQDSMTLDDCQLNSPMHKLQLENIRLDSPMKEGPSPSQQASNGDEDIDLSSGNNSDVDMDQSAEIFMGNSAAIHNELPLIPEDICSPEEGVDNFARVFESRYGEIHPSFFVGSLDGAVAEAFSREKRPLALYLHHDSSISANIFCTQVLASEQISQLLSANFVVWPWDITNDQNRQKLFNWTSMSFAGEVVNNAIQRFPTDTYPILIVVSKNKSQFEMQAMITGGMAVSEAMMQLMHAMEEYNKIVVEERREDEERLHRELIRNEQETAFNEALQQDVVKEQTRQLEEENVKRKIEEQRVEELKYEQNMQALAKLVPKEPEEGCSKPMATLRLRLPSGEMLQRRFLASNSLTDLLNFAASKGFHKEKFKFLTSYPKRDISGSSGKSTLEELKLCPREQITIEER